MILVRLRSEGAAVDACAYLLRPYSLEQPASYLDSSNHQTATSSTPHLASGMNLN